MANWKNKVVVVTGGSDGFGKTLALTFAAAGATTVAIARSADPLTRLTEHAQASGQTVDGIVGDVCDDQSISRVIDQIVDRYQRIDVWVNNVGKSTRGDFDQCGVEDYRSFLETNFYSAVRCTMAALEHLQRSSGQVVNIGSLVSKTGWPKVAPYAVSKSALAAFNHQLRIEGPANVNCLLVCPGPIQRADAETRYAAESAGMDQHVSQPGAGVRLKGIDPQKLALKIVKCCEKRKSELVWPWSARVLFAIAQLSPVVGDFLLRRSAKTKS